MQANSALKIWVARYGEFTKLVARHGEFKANSKRVKSRCSWKFDIFLTQTSILSSLFIFSLQETLPFARGKIPVKRTKSLANGTFVREKTRGRWPGKSAHRKHFARGYTPGRKTRG
ncbi:hypothetical protein MTR_5g086870 [Medicago truncatula]|uniref:Uncharacterized protein n=1 Tax=Medicago truncatula TaxID=3880 RepID=G7KHC5_MEDTR|nr:hypothetical protein MTR_5g086870 [Medicago truncatula]